MDVEPIEEEEEELEMRVVFMGTPDFAVGTLEALVKAET